MAVQWIFEAFKSKSWYVSSNGKKGHIFSELFRPFQHSSAFNKFHVIPGIHKDDLTAPFPSQNKKPEICKKMIHSVSCGAQDDHLLHASVHSQAGCRLGIRIILFRPKLYNLRIAERFQKFFSAFRKTVKVSYRNVRNKPCSFKEFQASVCCDQQRILICIFF